MSKSQALILGSSGLRTPPPRLVGSHQPPSLGHLRVPQEILESCSLAMHNLGGPALTELGVASAVRGEGRTSIAIAIAAAQARDYGRSALLVDADFDGPSIAGRFGLETAPGIAEVVSGQVGIDEALQQVADGISVLTSGTITTAPSRLAAAVLESNLLDEFQGEFDVVVIDLPAIRRSSSGPLLSCAIRPLLLVVRAEHTPLSEVQQAVELLDEPPAVILNGTSSRLPRWARR